MIRIAVAFSILVVGYVWGDWIGVYAALIICGLLGALFPYRTQVERELMPSDEDRTMWEKIEPARKGRSADPTRPDDHPLLLTNEVKGRRR
jgi:hypothetical protein